MNSDQAREAARNVTDIVPVVKARVIEPRVQVSVKKDIGILQSQDPSVRSNQVSGDDYATAFTNLGALDPLYDPEMLALIFEHSNSLRQNVDSYATNIDGFGHRFDPIIDVDAQDAQKRVAHAMLLDRMQKDPDNAQEPTDEESKIELANVIKQMRLEKSRLQHFFEFCSPDMSFVSLRRRMRQDLEVTGNAYWEVLRNRGGSIVQFVYVPSFTVRLLPLDPSVVPITQKIRVSELSFTNVEINARIRRFVQIAEGRSVFFKEFGDPRIISAQSGIPFPSYEEMMRAEPSTVPANELIHFKVHSPRSPYGVPRWVGNLLAVIGSRQSEEVNFNYFENKSVPPLAVLVSGGRMTEESVTRVTDYVEANIKGKRNFHKILVLEADSGSGSANDANSSKMKIDIKPLTSAQQQDALFQNYDERNIDKVGQSFRLPRMLRGDIRDFNRATADAALNFAEVQVFEPERQEFDFILNRKILSAMGIRFWKMVSLAPVIRDAVSMSEIIKNLSNANVLTPEEARELAGDVFNKSFPKINASWTKQPGAFTVAGIPVETAAPSEFDKPIDDPNFERPGAQVAPDRSPGEGIEASASQKARKKLTIALTKEVGRLINIKKALEATEETAWESELLKIHREAG